MFLVMIKAKPSAMEGIRRNSAKLAALFLAVFLFAQPAAAELATLRNGYSIRHDHHMVMGATTRLYLSADDSSFTDVPTEEITGFEKSSHYLPLHRHPMQRRHNPCKLGARNPSPENPRCL